MEIAYLFLGWLLGMVSPVIVSRAKRKYTKNDLHVVILRELDEVQFRHTCVCFTLGLRFGCFDREFLSWCRNNFESYLGGENKEKHIEAVDHFLNMTSEQITQVINEERKDPNRGTSLKKTILTFSELNLTDISVFSFEFQNSIFELRARVNNLNQEVERAERFHFMTFDSSISDENHQIIKNEIYEKYKTIQDMTINVVDKISEIKHQKKY